jgi:hypothetical protein
MDKKYRLSCISCGNKIGQFRDGFKNLELHCDKCGSEFELTVPLSRDSFTVMIKNYSGKIDADNELENYAYPSIFCPFHAFDEKAKRIVLQEPKSNYIFKCPYKDCHKKFIVLFNEDAFSS